MTDQQNLNVAAVVDGDCVLSLDGRTGLSMLPATEPWPDLAEIAKASGVATVLPLGPARRLTDPGAVIHVVAGHGPPSLAGTSWTPLDSLGGRDVPAAVTDVITATLDEHHGTARRPAQRPDWFRHGWLDEADAWIDECVADAGLRRAGPIVPARLWSLSAVLSTPVEGVNGETSVWFKATCDWFRAEASITGVVATFAGAHVPTLITIDHERAWMLMEQLSGPDLYGRTEFAPMAATAIADIQIRAVDHVPSLVAAGCPDRTLQPTIEEFRRLVHDSVELDLLTPDERATAIEMEPWVAERTGELFDSGLPFTVTHGDCHLGNVAVDGNHVVVYDWTDACVSHPFIDGVHLVRSAGDDHHDAIKAAYTAPWRESYGADIDRAWDLAKFGDRVFQAISYEAIYRAQEKSSRWEMAGVVAGTLRQLGTEFRSADRTTPGS